MRCKICRTKFKKRSISHKTCPNVDCALAWVAQENERNLKKVQRQDRKETKLKLETYKRLSAWEEELQVLVNKFCRLRDIKNGYGCISCGSMTSYPRWQGGHYLSVGLHHNLRFNEDNIHAQCVQCNMHKAGNASAYRMALVNRIGLSRVEELENDQGYKKWSVEEIKQLKIEYRLKIKELKHD